MLLKHHHSEQTISLFLSLSLEEKVQLTCMGEDFDPNSQERERTIKGVPGAGDGQGDPYRGQNMLFWRALPPLLPSFLGGILRRNQ